MVKLFSSFRRGGSSSSPREGHAKKKTLVVAPPDTPTTSKDDHDVADQSRSPHSPHPTHDDDELRAAISPHSTHIADEKLNVYEGFDGIGDVDTTSYDEEEDVEEDDNNPINEIIKRIKVMKVHEDAMATCYNYLQLNHAANKDTYKVDESCRTSMVTYIQQLQKSLKLSSETTYIAISFFDRYLSSGRGKSNDALGDKYKFQLACITSFYMTVKLFELTSPIELNVVTLARVCKGYYNTSDILDMEQDIYNALYFPCIDDFRTDQPTAMRFVLEFVGLLPEHIDKNRLFMSCMKRVEDTLTDIYFTVCKPSVVGASVICSILVEEGLFSPSEQKAFYIQIANTVDIVNIMEAENVLLTGHTKPVSIWKLTNEYYQRRNLSPEKLDNVSTTSILKKKEKKLSSKTKETVDGDDGDTLFVSATSPKHALTKSLKWGEATTYSITENRDDVA